MTGAAVESGLFLGSVPGGQFGASVSGAGDINGDGISDMLFGAYAELTTGSTYLLYGDATQFNDPNHYQTTDMSFKTIGNSANSYEGETIAAAGDVNGDGYGDFLIGAPQSNTAKGYAKIFAGDGAAQGSLAEMAYLVGETDNDFFGETILGAQDLNADGYDDILVGAHGHDNVGAVYVFMDHFLEPLTSPQEIWHLGS